MNVLLLGVLPIDPRLGALLGKACVAEFPESPAAEVFNSIIKTVTSTQINK